MNDKKIISKLNELHQVIFSKTDLIEGDKIGKGGFSKVIKANFKSQDLALKKLKCFDPEAFVKEITCLKMLRHSFLPCFYGVYVDKQKLGLVLDYISGITLDKLSPLYDSSAPFLQKLIHVIDLVTIIDYMHKVKLIHRDLKPNNIIIDNELNLKLLDFGISKMSDRSKTTTLMKGTVLYMAPENFVVPSGFDLNESESILEDTDSKSFQMDYKQRKNRIIITNKVDIWALGCIFNEIFSGEKPWMSQVSSDGEIIGKLYMGESFPISKKIKNCVIKNLIGLCTANDYSQRPDADCVKYILLKLLYLITKDVGLNSLLGGSMPKDTSMINILL